MGLYDDDEAAEEENEGGVKKGPSEGIYDNEKFEEGDERAKQLKS